MSLSNAAVSLDCSDNISIATTSTTTSTPIEKEEAPIVAPPKSPSLSPSLLLPPSPPSPPSPQPPQPPQPEEKQQPILDSAKPLSSPEHPDKQTEQGQEQEDNGGQKGKQAEQAEHHETNSTKYSGATESPLEAFKPKEQVISFDFEDTPLIADDEVDDEESEYDLSKTLEEEMAQMSKIRGRDRETMPGAKRVLKRVRVRKDTSSSKRRTKKHNLRATMNSAVIAEKLAAERGERSGGKEPLRSGGKEPSRREKKKERLAAVVEWKPIVEPVSKPRARPSGLRFSMNCYSDPEDDDDDEGQGSEQTGHKRKREDQDLGDEDDEDESLDGYFAESTMCRYYLNFYFIFSFTVH
ncbi:uncharacterized protein LAJ45_05027 [Morchella importuna]|uniref:uncharacterized protein n=1 Tax=Morchella importuna TaxID=1174673 RepID=UPI001E8DE578|nr:uncharacterized protein LAJ45_05027 [Morchella importuna]KAH8150846.1 hypothetical protein LAJ45_05027 [Morchella importuna]